MRWSRFFRLLHLRQPTTLWERPIAVVYSRRQPEEERLMNDTPACIALFACLGLILGGCSSEDTEGRDHVWKHQVETIDKAREVEGIVLDAAKQQKKNAEDASY